MEEVLRWLFSAVIMIIMIVVTGAIYFIPSFMAAKKENAVAIFWLNFLFGWSFLGWVICFIWAAVSPKAKDETKEFIKQYKKLNNL